MDKKDLLEIIDSRLTDLQLSSSAASQMAVGNDALISNIRRKRHGLPSLENLEKLADVLGLELYFGHPRQSGETINPLSNHEKVTLLDDFAFVDRFDVQLSAGPGANGDNARQLSPVAFRKEWLSQQGLRADRCVVCSVRGNSMEPMLFDGDLVLLNKNRSETRDGQVFGVVDIEGDVRIKRLERVNGGLLLRSDNPECPTELRLGEDANRVRIIGALAWSSHSHLQTLSRRAGA
jgi:hypothetical protein